MAEITKNTQTASILQDLVEERRRAEITDRKRIDSARSWAHGWIEEHNLNYIAFARTIGLGDSGRTPISRFVQGKLEGDVMRLVLAIEQYRATIEGPGGISSIIGFRQTRTVHKVWAFADEARDGHKLAALIGPTGYGKTLAIRNYQRRSFGDKKSPVRVLTCNPQMTPSFICRLLALNFGVAQKGEPAMLLELIARHLRGHPEFLIFDECNFLGEKCLQNIRFIHDTTGIGMLMIGTPWFLNMVANRSRSHVPDPLGDKMSMLDGPLALFADRIFADVIPGLFENEIVEITEDVLRAELEPEAITKLVFLVNHNFRLLSRILIELREAKKKTGVHKIGGKMVESAWATLQHIGIQIQ
jgi:DNA transposition AAA+ family ATPase